MITCADTTSCASPENGTCQCETEFICVADSRCNPESIAGPRGDFQSLEIVQGAGPCPPGETCIWSWTFTPDGHVEYSKNGVAGSAELTETDLAMLLSAVNGVDLRLAMRDGITCDPPPTDVGVTFRLTLSTQTLESDATGCAIPGPDGNVFDVLFELTTRY